MRSFVLDGSGKGFFDSLSSCTGHPLAGVTSISVLSVVLSLKKKELFNIKEAHNHSFSHAVCPPFSLVYCNFWSTVFRQRTGDGMTVNHACHSQS
jgi:hypothetical protein